jgi:hypothetical protein
MAACSRQIQDLNGSAQRAVSDLEEPEYAPLFSAGFLHPSTFESSKIVPNRVIIQCKNVPSLPEADSNDFDDEEADQSEYWDDVDNAIVNSQCIGAGFDPWDGTEDEEVYRAEDDYQINAFLEDSEAEVVAYWAPIRALCVTLPEGTTISQAILNWPTTYSALIDTVEPDYCGEYLAFPATAPNDEKYAVNGSPDQGQWNLRAINIDDVWPDYTPYPNTAKIAILDTGVDRIKPNGYTYGHSDLAAFSTAKGCNVIANANGLYYTGFGDRRTADYGNGRPRNPYLTDPIWHASNAQQLGHGTCVAGVCSATMNNDTASTPDVKDACGIANYEQYFPVCMDATMNPSQGDCMPFRSTFISSLVVLACVKGIYPPNKFFLPAYAAQCPRYNIEAVNMSFGWRDTSTNYPSEVYMLSLLSNHMVFVAGAGNDGTATALFPASSSYVIAVASYGRDGAPCTNTSYGSVVDVAAPGIAIWSTDMVGTNGSPYNDNLGYDSGEFKQSSNTVGSTSLAAPHVTAVTAMLCNSEPNLTSSQVFTRVKGTGSYFSQTGYTHIRKLDADAILDL